MDEKNFIITITGPSQSGKTLAMGKILCLKEKIQKKGYKFCPEKIVKYTTRHLRLEEMNVQEQRWGIDVEYTSDIPQNCDLVYQTYGVRYGLDTSKLKEKLNMGVSPIVVLNDIRAVEEIRRCFAGQVLSLFMFRKIPVLNDFKIEAKIRGNVSEHEVNVRYEKAVSIYRTYIENIVLFDHVILNSIEYKNGKELSSETVLDKQLENVIMPILEGVKSLRSGEVYVKSPKIFVIAGNAASGKDELVRALISMGKLQADVLPKYTMRPQEPEDGAEMICQYVPRKLYIQKMQGEYNNDQYEIVENLNKISGEFKKKYLSEFVAFQQQLEESNMDAYGRFWKSVIEKVNEYQCFHDSILQEYFEKNPEYVDLKRIKYSFNKICGDGTIGVFEKDKKRYLIYGSDQKLYGCDISNVQSELQADKKLHLVIVASQMGVVHVLKELYGDQNVKLIYAHSDISADEFEAKSSDITKDDKKKEFEKILETYTQNISDYDHVTIYAKSQLIYEQASKEEELVDQMFRLLRAYL